MKLPRLLTGDEDYRSIARAVQGPMHRWWRRVGVWWISFGFLLVLVSAAFHMDLAINGYYSPYSLLREIYNFIPGGLTALVAGVVWLLAANRAIHAFEGLAEVSAGTLGSQWRTSIRFRLALTQALWPLILLAFQHFPLPYSFRRLAVDVPPVFNVIIGYLAFWSGNWLYYVVAIAWIAGLLALKNAPRCLVWLWMIALFGFPIRMIIGRLLGVMHVDLPHMSGPMYEAVGPATTQSLTLLALVLTAGALYLISRGKRLGFTLAWIIGVTGVISALDVSTRTHNSLDINWTFYADQVLAAVCMLQPWWPEVWAHYIELATESRIMFNFPFWHTEMIVLPWLFWITLPVQLAVTAGYLWLIHFVITRGAAGQRRDPALQSVTPETM